MEKVNSKATYSVFSLDNCTETFLTGKEAKEFFGKDEFKEMLNGYAPQFVVVKLQLALFVFI